MKISLTNFAKIVILTINIFTVPSVNAQNHNPQLAPTINPPEPEAGLLAKFGSYETNYFTGLTDISIPLHEIEIKDLKVPIVLKYHPSGIKVNDRPTWVGLGWALDVGGSISRQTIGRVDEEAAMTGGVPPDSEINLENYDHMDISMMEQISTMGTDAEPDIYNYSFGGYSGKFLRDIRKVNGRINQLLYVNSETENSSEATAACDEQGLLGDGSNYIMLPYQPVLIANSNDPNDGIRFICKDPSGKEYRFQGLGNHTSYKIASIRSPQTGAQIDFDYVDREGADKTIYELETYSQKVRDEYIVTGDEHCNDKVTFPPPTLPTHQVDIVIPGGTKKVTDIYEKYLSEINFPGGRISFVLSIADRDGGYEGQKRLEKIFVYRGENVVKQVIFNYGAFVYDYESELGQGIMESERRLKLESVVVRDALGKNDQKYEFEYNSTQLPEFNSLQRDRFGYFNGKPNENLIERKQIQVQSTSGHILNLTIGNSLVDGLEPDETKAKACILKKITYPTGGFTEFSYQGNIYVNSNGDTKKGGGLRIRSIVSNPGYGMPSKVQTIEYGPGRKNFFNSGYLYTDSVYVHSLNSCNYSVVYRERTYRSSPTIGLEPYDGATVVYPQVTVYEGVSSNNAAKTVYTYKDIADNNSDVITYGAPLILSNHWRRGQLLKTEYFGNGWVGKPRVVENVYGGFGECEVRYIGAKAVRQHVAPDKFEVTNNNMPFSYDQWKYVSYGLKTGGQVLLQSIEYNYGEDEVFTPNTKITKYRYDNYKHLQPNTISTVNSQGLEEVKEITYSGDLTTSPYDEMNTEGVHIIASPVTESTSIDGTNIDEINRVYVKTTIDEKDIYEIAHINRKFQDEASYREVTFDKRDEFGNVQQMTTRDGLVKSYIWGYEGRYVLAEIIGATYDEVTGSLSEGVSNALMELTDDQREEIQSAFPQVQIQTYTYEEGLGLNSITDSNGQKSTYIYDNMSRLKQIVDHNGHVIRQFKYNYANR